MEPDVIKRLRDGESLHDNPNFTEADGKEIVNHIDRITDALAEKNDGGWMPIETAPKDGTKFIAEWVSRSKGSVPIVIGTEYYISTRDGDEFWWARLPLPDGFKPKRWCPLPPPKGE